MKVKKERTVQQSNVAAVYESKACACVRMGAGTIEMILSGQMPEGDVLHKARIFGLQAMKRSQGIFPFVPPLADDAVKITLVVRSADKVDILAAAVSTTKENADKASVMAASMTALSLYNLCHPMDEAVEIGNVTSFEKKKIA